MSNDPLRSYARFQARLYGLDPDQFERQIQQESGFNPSARSSAGARGIGQFIEETGKAYGLLTDKDFEDPYKGLSAGARHMADLKREAGGDEKAALVGYNAGAGRMRRYQRSGTGLPAETRNYVSSITGRAPEQQGRAEDDGTTALNLFNERIKKIAEGARYGVPPDEFTGRDIGMGPPKPKRRALDLSKVSGEGEASTYPMPTLAQPTSVVRGRRLTTVTSPPTPVTNDEQDLWRTFELAKREGFPPGSWEGSEGDRAFRNLERRGWQVGHAWDEQGNYWPWVKPPRGKALQSERAERLTPETSARIEQLRTERTAQATKDWTAHLEELRNVPREQGKQKAFEIVREKGTISQEERTALGLGAGAATHPYSVLTERAFESLIDFASGVQNVVGSGAEYIGATIRDLQSGPRKLLEAVDEALGPPGGTAGILPGNVRRIIREGERTSPATTLVTEPLSRAIEEWGRGEVGQAGEVAQVGGAPPGLRKDVASGAGTSLPFFAAGGVGGTAGRILTGALGWATNAGQVYDDALRHGASREDALLAAHAGGPVGLTEMFGLGGTLDRVGRRKLIEGFAKSLVRETGRETLEEGVQNPTQELLNNWIAQGYYDPDRQILANVGYSALVGGLTGGLMGGGAHATARLADRLGEAMQPAAPPAAPAPAPSPIAAEVQQHIEQTAGIVARSREAAVTREHLEAVAKGEPKATLVPTIGDLPVSKGALESQGLAVTETPAGVFIHNSKIVSRKAVRKAVEEGTYEGLLGKEESYAAQTGQEPGSDVGKHIGVAPGPAVSADYEGARESGGGPTGGGGGVPRGGAEPQAPPVTTEAPTVMRRPPKPTIAPEAAAATRVFEEARERAIAERGEIPPEAPSVEAGGGKAANVEDSQELAEIRKEELEGIDFFIRHGNRDIAEGTLDRLYAETPNDVELLRRYHVLGITPPSVEAKGGKAAVPVRDNKYNAPKTAESPKPTPEPQATGKLPFHRSLIGEVEAALRHGEKIDNPKLTSLADKAFGGTRADGKYTPRDAYDAVEVAVNRVIADNAKALLENDPAQESIGFLTRLMDQLPRQADRTTEQVEFQQFSTPPWLAFVAAKAADIRPTDVVLEPSAGTGSLAVWAKSVAAKVHTNEIAPRRADLLESQGYDVTRVDAEKLDDLLPQGVKPTLVIMNPPFSATGGRIVRHKTEYGAAHVEQALRRLAPGGRLVAIVGRGMAFDKPMMADWWKGIAAKYDIKANIGVSGKLYGKYGTTFDNRLIIIDKTGPSAAGWNQHSSEHTEPGGLLDEVQQVAANRPEAKAVRDLGQPAGPGSAAVRAGKRPTQRGGLLPGAVPRRKGGGRAVSAGRPSEARSEEGVETVPRGEPGPQPEPTPEGGTIQPGGGAPESAGGGVSTLPPTKREAEAGGAYVEYKPHYLPERFKHPAKIVESASMASIAPPPITYKVAIPEATIKKGGFSDLALEFIHYAGQRHSVTLPNGQRSGIFNGDGPGVGKGRQIAGVILDNWEQGRRKALWVSMSRDLKEAAGRDLRDIHAGYIPLLSINDYGPGDSISARQGVVFSTYSSLIGKAKNGRTRLQQVIEWLGEDGILIFDEAHKAKNALAAGGGQPTQTGQAVIDLQEKLPGLRVVYSSATGATDVRNMAYMTRLGMWGRGTPFPDGFIDFLGEIESGGLGAMEMVARDMKAVGAYVSRNLSYEGTSYRKVEHKLSPEQREMYDIAARAWQIVLKNFGAAVEVTGAGSRGKGRAASAFWSAHQRFFKQVITAMKLPTVLREAEAALARGESVVISLKGTGEARTSAKVADAVAEGNGLDDLDFTPREILVNLIDKSFPTQAFEEYTDDVTGQLLTRPVVDADGNPVQSQEAVRMKQALLDQLSDFNVPDNPLDQIVNHFGPDKVAEMTGRKRRLVRNPNTGRIEYAKRATEVSMDKMNIHENELFQSGKKRIAIISQAASTGIDLHASLDAKNQEHRNHFALEVGWSADQELQTFGRTHRSNEASGPEYILPYSDVGGERRFISTLARRLDGIGALTKGQREATGTGASALGEFNFETKEGEGALTELYKRVMANPREVAEQAGLEEPQQALRDMGILKQRQGGETIDDKDLRDVPRFLNRVLALELDRQNPLFDYFARLYGEVVQRAKEEGTFDEGVADIKAESVRLKQSDLLHRDASSQAETRHYGLDADMPTKPVKWKEVDVDGADFYRNKRSGKVFGVRPGPSRTDPRTGQVTRPLVIGRPREFHAGTIESWEVRRSDRFEHLDPPAAKKLWDAEVEKIGKIETRRLHVIGGALLPIWNKLQAAKATGFKVVRVTTDEGQRIVGIQVPERHIDEVIQSLGIALTASTESPLAVFESVRGGAEVALQGGLKLAKRKVHRDDVIELIGAKSSSFGRLREIGLIDEVIDYKQRFFVPIDEDAGPKILEELFKDNPPIAQEGAVKEKPAAYGEQSRYVVKKEMYHEQRGETGPFHEVWRVYDSQTGRRAEMVDWSDARKAQKSADRLNNTIAEVRETAHYEPTGPNPEASRQLANEGLAELSRPVEVSRTRMQGADAERARQGGTRILGLGITEPLRRGYIDLRGLKAPGVKDVVRLAQVYRNPKFETSRVIWMKGDEIVAVEGISSRLPDASAVFVKRKTASQSFEEMRRRAKRLGADGYYLLHNHPSGRPEPSAEDRALTKLFARGGPGITPVEGFKGHIVINHEEFALIDGEGYAEMRTLGDVRTAKIDPLAKPAVEHPLLGTTITDAKDLAKLAKKLEASPNVAVIIYRTRSWVRALEEVPLGLLRNSKALADHLRGRLKQFGAQNALSVSFTEDAKVEAVMRDAVRLGYVLDHYTAALPYSQGAISESGIGSRYRSHEFKPGRRVGEEPSPYGGERPVEKYKGFEDEEIERRFKEAHGVKPPSLRNRIAEVALHLKRIATRDFEHLPRTGEYAELRNALHRLSTGKGVWSDEAVRRLTDLTKNLSKEDAALFERKVILDDLMEEVERQSAEGAQPDEEIRLPFRFTPDSLTREWNRANGHVVESQAVQDALAARKQLVNEVSGAYLKAAEDAIGFKPRLTRQHYFHHQVLEYASAPRVKGTGQKIKAPTARTFLKRRHGSELDINTNYLEAEATVLSQMMYDTQVFNLLSLVDEHHNIADNLRVEAREANKRAMQEIIDKEDLLTKAVQPPSGRKSLSQFVRARGGMAVKGGMFAGELDRLRTKESGTTGLVSQKGVSPDTMREYAVEAGYFQPGDLEDENVGTFLEAVEADALGQRRTYSLLDEAPEAEEARGEMFLTVGQRMKLFRQAIGRGFAELRDLAKENQLWNGENGEWDRAIRNLTAHRNYDEQMSEGNAIFKYLAALASEQSRDGNLQARMILKAISQRRAFVKQTLGPKYKEWDDLVPEGRRIWQPREGNVFFNSYTLPERLINEALENFYESIGFQASDLRRAMVMGGKRTQFVIPDEVAVTLDDFAKPPSDNPIERGGRAVVRGWKVWQLLSPFRAFKYNARNISGDAEAVFVGNPRAFAQAPRATKELFNYLVRKKQPGPELLEWLHRGGMQNLFQVAEGVGNINGLKMFANFQTDKGGRLQKLNLWKQWFRLSRMTTDFRESILRYAAFLDYLGRIKAGALKNYGASIPEEVDALSNPYDRAYKLANDLLGAYDEVTVLGRQLRESALPFWSWQEVNAKRYYRLLKNTFHESDNASRAAQSLLGKAARLSPVLGFRIGKFVLKAAGLAAMLAAYNNLRYPDEERELGPKLRARVHIILGRNADGSIRYFDRLGMLGDFLSWFGLDEAPHTVNQFLNNKKTLKEIALDMAKAPANKLWQSTGPIKTLFETVGGVSTYPDVSRPKNIRDRWQFLARSLAVGDEYDLIAGRPSRGTGRLIRGLFFYEVDPDESAFNQILSLKSDFNRKRGKAADVSVGNDKANAAYYLKLALRYGDVEGARQYLQEYGALGGTGAGLQQSLQTMAPLAGLTKAEQKEFLASLTPDEQAKMTKAQAFFDAIQSKSEIGPADLLLKPPAAELREPVEGEAKRLGMTLPFPHKGVEINREQVDVSNEKFKEFEQRTVERAYSEASRLITAKSYLGLSDEQRKTTLKRLFDLVSDIEHERLRSEIVLESKSRYPRRVVEDAQRFSERARKAAEKLQSPDLFIRDVKERQQEAQR